MQIITLPVGSLQENCYIVWKQSPGPAAVIDPGSQPKDILAALRERDLTLTHIMLTHAHFDHLLAAPALQKETGAPVYVHRLDLNGVKHLRMPFFVLRYTPPDDLRTVEDGNVIGAGGLAFTVRHTPGHTPGSCCLACQPIEASAMSSHNKYAIFTGDTLFAGDCGRVDLPEGSPDEMRRSLAAIAGWTGAYDVYPGHGPSTTLAREQAANPYLQPPFRL